MKIFKIHAVASYLSAVDVEAETKDEAWIKAQSLKDGEFKDMRNSRSVQRVDLHEVSET